MAKKTTKKVKTTGEVIEMTMEPGVNTIISDETKVEETPRSELKSSKQETKQIPMVMMNFDRWFALQNRPAHHKFGMKAYAKTKGKKAVEAWDIIFKDY